MCPVVAVASGKGGTGKTTFAVNLAASLAENASYMDADVEEPNGHIFLKPQMSGRVDVRVMIPVVDEKLCSGCGRCSEVCRFNALIVIKKDVMLFPELCHGCGACILACPESAIKEEGRVIGEINVGSAGAISFTEGRLNEGEAKSPPLIKALHKYINRDKIQIIDVSPGSSCPVIEGVRQSDFVVLVAEPTPFGLHDLVLAVEMVKRLGLPHGVVINRANLGDDAVERYCRQEGIPVLMKIPFSRRTAYLCSEGRLLAPDSPAFKREFLQCWEQIMSILAARDSEVKV
jgi:MinD superfamily P-loop ATPase